jgi:FkbM family methyltransferase
VADGRFVYDSLGVRTDPRFRPQFRPQPAGPLKTEHPRPQPEYLELVFVLDSVATGAGRGDLTVVELGAGYGRWLVAAHHAARRVADCGVRLVGVEMVPRHFDWMHDHLRNNGIDPAAHRLIHAAVSDRDGQAWYRPDPDPAAAYGLSVYHRGPGGAEPAVPAGTGPVRVPCIELAGLLRELEAVDLLHCDIQGEELPAVGSSLDELGSRVRRLLVATHSSAIHRRLRAMLAEARWELRYDFRPRRRERTPHGDVRFLDGLLACVNPALESGHESSAPGPS